MVVVVEVVVMVVVMVMVVVVVVMHEAVWRYSTEQESSCTSAHVRFSTRAEVQHTVQYTSS